jgi:hypothetical protein
MMDELVAFLLAPIVKDDLVIRYDDQRHVIHSTNIMYHPGSWDPDMSDVAIQWYQQVLYPDLYHEDQLILGDTMHSFNTMANRIPGAGSSRLMRTSEAEWPEFLRRYYHHYHCLANFWVLPAAIGRGFATRETTHFRNRAFYDGGDDPCHHLATVKTFLYRDDHHDLPSDATIDRYYDAFGQGSEGWSRFCDRHVLASYIDDHDDPIDISTMSIRDRMSYIEGLWLHRAEDIAQRYSSEIQSFMNDYVHYHATS